MAKTLKKIRNAILTVLEAIAWGLIAILLLIVQVFDYEDISDTEL